MEPPALVLDTMSRAFRVLAFASSRAHQAEGDVHDGYDSSNTRFIDTAALPDVPKPENFAFLADLNSR